MLVRVTNVKTSVATGTSGMPGAAQEFTVKADPSADATTLTITSYYLSDINAAEVKSTVGQAYASITGNPILSGPGTTTPTGKLAPGATTDLVAK